MYKLKQIAGLINAPLAPDYDAVSIRNFSALNEATEHDLSFFADAKYAEDFENSRAAAIIVSKAKEVTHNHSILLKVDDVRVAVATLLHHLHQANRPAPGIHLTAVIHKNAKVASDAYIGPFVVIDSDVQIGNLVQVHAHTSIGQGSSLGAETILHAGVRIYPQTKIGKRCIIHANAVLGSDGFGYAPNEKGILIKIPQVGIVELEDDVEIGANTVIDRASLGKTHICNGVKLDNLIQIAHNVKIGEHTAIAAQAGIAGSTSIGNHSRIGGQAGIVGHIHIPANTSIQAQSGVIKAPAKPGTALYGSPAFDYRSFMKSYAFFKNLPAIIHDLKNKA